MKHTEEGIISGGDNFMGKFRLKEGGENLRKL